MFFSSESHLNFYDYVYGPNRFISIRDQLYGLPKPSRRRRCRSESTGFTSLPCSFGDSRRSSSDQSVQTDTSIAVKVDKRNVREEYYLDSAHGTRDNVTSPDENSVHAVTYIIQAEIHEDKQNTQFKKECNSESKDSNKSKLDHIACVKNSPYKKNLLKSKPVKFIINNPLWDYYNPSSIPSDLQDQTDLHIKLSTPIEPLTPPSPAPKDPDIEKSRQIPKNKTKWKNNGNEFSSRKNTYNLNSLSPPTPEEFKFYNTNLSDQSYEFGLPPKTERQRSREHYEEKNYNSHGPHRSMGRMNPLEDHERKVIIEFCHLLEKSKQLFNGLRELPQYGHKQWHSYFGRTFDVYTKLWKFQQQHRIILDSKYGLKRWQIGEIASKIGQLYYHFYLRTSETAYLNEAFSFYYAIRGRSYYTRAANEDKCELMVKKLRYYARFIVVCLLLNRVKLVKELIKELDRQIIEYGNNYDPDDHIEWTVVVDEVKAFLEAQNVVSVIHPDNYPVILSHRLNPLSIPPVERSAQMILSLQEILIVGSNSQQVKFSELTMDMFRMLQTLEREPSVDIQHMYDESPRQRFIPTPSATTAKSYLDNIPRGENPHKYLLFKPSPSQILVYLGSGCNDLPPNGVLLLYISADGQIAQPSRHTEDGGYENGGLITTNKSDIHRECPKDSKTSSSKSKEPLCLYPGDISPFTRRPLFIIIESDNSYVFQNIPRLFGQPLVILMSPMELPSNYHDRRHLGSLFTLFLHSPLTAFCECCDIRNISLVHWERAQVYVDAFLTEASQIVIRSRIDQMYVVFMGDDFLRLILLRFIFCEVTLRVHKAFRARTHLTRSSPQIPDEIFDHPSLVHMLMDLATHLQVRSHFHQSFGSEPQAGSNKE